MPHDWRIKPTDPMFLSMLKRGTGSLARVFFQKSGGTYDWLGNFQSASYDGSFQINNQDTTESAQAQYWIKCGVNEVDTGATGTRSNGFGNGLIGDADSFRMLAQNSAGNNSQYKHFVIEKCWAESQFGCLTLLFKDRKGSYIPVSFPKGHTITRSDQRKVYNRGASTRDFVQTPTRGQIQYTIDSKFRVVAYTDWLSQAHSDYLYTDLYESEEVYEVLDDGTYIRVILDNGDKQKQDIKNGGIQHIVSWTRSVDPQQRK